MVQMKKTVSVLSLLILLLLLTLGAQAAPTFPVLWNTFQGGAGIDYNSDMVVDAAGNVYLVGTSYATWGTPLAPFPGVGDYCYVAKLDPAGILLWNTFLGADGYCGSIRLDPAGFLYIAGSSSTSWGTPIRPQDAGTNDGFVAKMSQAGSLLWNTFLGGDDWDTTGGISLDSAGYIYATGSSRSTWGTPLNAYTAGTDTYAAKLAPDGSLVWNTFMGGPGTDYGEDIAISPSGYLYVGGRSNQVWGTPILPFDNRDVFLARLTPNGAFLWNTFVGGAGDAYMYWPMVVTDGADNAYLSGYAYDTGWGTPLRPHSGEADGFVARFNPAGALQWNTFLGGSGDDAFVGDMVYSNGSILVTGWCEADWGDAILPYTQGFDMCAVQLNTNGSILMNLFLGGTGDDFSEGMAVGQDGSLYLAGDGDASWGSPVRAYSSDADGFTARLDVLKVFEDVPASQWAWSWIERLYHSGVTAGCSGSAMRYCPEDPVTRAQMAVFLERGMRGRDYTPPAATGAVFADVSTSTFAAGWIEKLYADSITAGCSLAPLMYCPDNNVLRLEMAVFLLRAKYGALYVPPPATGIFNDVPASFWAAAWIEQLAEEGITAGCGGGNYCPYNHVTRAEMAVFLVKTFILP